VTPLRRSGTNAFHGSVYEFLRNSAWTPKNYFDPAQPNTLFRRNQFGGQSGTGSSRITPSSCGLRGIRQAKGASISYSVPSVNARNEFSTTVILRWHRAFHTNIGGARAVESVHR